MERKSTEELVEKINEEGYRLTGRFAHAIYLMEDGRMIDGDFQYGSRCEDHRMMESVIDGDRYDDDFWDKVHGYYNLVRLVPESATALIRVGQELTQVQVGMINRNGYVIEEY